MNHPFFKDSKSIFIFCAIWVVIIITQIVVLSIATNAEIIEILSDGMVFNSIFSVISAILWYPVFFYQNTKVSSINLIISQFTILLIVLVIWISGSISVINLFLPSDTQYINYLYGTLPIRIFTGALYYFIIILVYYLFINYNNLKSKIETENNLKNLLRESELNLLKSQINPHFLFNSLNSISSLTLTNPEKAQEMIIKLSDFLRYTVSNNIHQLSTVDKEFENISLYLEIEKIRFGKKLKYEFEFRDHCEKHPIPAMILQPLYENAVKHGVYESTDEIFIKTVCNKTEDSIWIVITNNFDSKSKIKKGTGIGLKNIRERLRLVYNNEKLLNVNILDNIFEVKLIIPTNTKN